MCLFSALEDVMNEKVPLRPGQDNVIEELCRDLAASGHQCKRTDSGHWLVRHGVMWPDNGLWLVQSLWNVNTLSNDVNIVILIHY